MRWTRQRRCGGSWCSSTAGRSPAWTWRSRRTCRSGSSHCPSTPPNGCSPPDCSSSAAGLSGVSSWSASNRTPTASPHTSWERWASNEHGSPTSWGPTARTAASARGSDSSSPGTRFPRSTCSATSRWTGPCPTGTGCGRCTRPTAAPTTCWCASRCPVPGGIGCRCWSPRSWRPDRQVRCSTGSRAAGLPSCATSRRCSTGWPPSRPAHTTCAGPRCSGSATD